MAREKAPCGTVTAYNRHRRNKEDPCEECKAAKREHQQGKRQQQRDMSAETFTATVIESDSDRLTDARENLHLVISLMQSGLALPQMAQLSKRRQELQDYIYQLQAEAQSGAEVSRYDEIAARRNRRQSAA